MHHTCSYFLVTVKDYNFQFTESLRPKTQPNKVRYQGTPIAYNASYSIQIFRKITHFLCAKEVTFLLLNYRSDAVIKSLQSTKPTYFGSDHPRVSLPARFVAPKLPAAQISSKIVVTIQSQSRAMSITAVTDLKALIQQLQAEVLALETAAAAAAPRP
jgi:hypothetical protein